MKPLSLRLKGFTGIRCGMNRDEVSIDFSACRGLVALIGPNGSGKTTVIDNMTPYRVMPFRASGYSPGKFSYYDQTEGEAEKELIWEHGGVKYRTLIQVNNTRKTPATKAYLFSETPDGWAPAAVADGTFSDGKTDTYDHCVNAIMGTPELFFAANFQAQERKRLSDYKAADIKGLLSELLGLERPLELSAQAEERAKLGAAKLDQMRAGLAEYEDAKAAVAQEEGAVQSARAQLTEATAAQGSARAAARQAAQNLAEVRARASINSENARQREQLKRRLAEIADDITRARAKLAEDLEQIRARGEARDQVRARDQIKLRITNAEQRLGTDERRLSGLPDPAAAAKDLAEAQAALDQVETSLMAAKDVLDKARPWTLKVVELRGKLENAKATGKDKAADLDSRKARAALTGQVPCAGTPMNSACELLKDARAAGATVQGVEAEVNKLRSDYQDLLGQVNDATAKARLYDTALAEVQRLERELTDRRLALNKAQKAVQDAAGAAELTASIQAVRVDLEASKLALADATAAVEQCKASAAAELEGRKKAAQEEAQHIHSRKGALEGQLAGIPADIGAEDLAKAERDLAAADATLSELDARLLQLQNAIATAEAGLARHRQVLADGEAAAKRAAELADDVAQWRLLAKGLGRDGVVALSIDDAGPSISSIANDLLLECYGPRFSLRFDTQSETAKGTLKETFDIRVFDAEREDDKSVTVMSGGERMYVNDALTRAIALFRAQQSGQHYQCLFSDESDGGLDTERKVHFMKVKRKVLDIGGYEAEFCITHTAALWEMADQVIDIGALRA